MWDALNKRCENTPSKMKIKTAFCRLTCDDFLNVFICNRDRHRKGFVVNWPAVIYNETTREQMLIAISFIQIQLQCLTTLDCFHTTAKCVI